MKKYLAQILSIVAFLTLSSCEKTNIIENFYPNPNKSFIYTILSNQWVDNGYQIYHTLNLPELTDYYIKQGGVSVAMSFDNEASYDILPATFDGVAYSVRYSLGKVTIYAEDPIADPSIIVPLPAKVTVKIILSETDYVE